MATPKTGQPTGRPKGRKTSKTAPSVLEVQKKRADALAFRLMGHTFEVIGEQIGVTTQRAHQLVLEALNDTLTEPAEELRSLEVSRLDQMMTGVYSAAVLGDTKAIDSVLKIQERRAKLLGMDAPTKSEITGAEGGPVLFQKIEYEIIDPANPDA